MNNIKKRNDGEGIPGIIAAFSVPGDLAGLNLPTPEEVTYYNDRKNRVLYLDCEEIDTGDAIELSKQILAINREDAGIPVEDRLPIILEVSSYGGALDESFGLADIMIASKTPVYTVCIGVAMSAAMLIFLAGHKRFCFKHGQLLIHQGSASLSGTAQSVQEATANYKAQLQQMKDYILERTEIPENIYKKKQKSDWYLSIQEITDYKVATIIDSVDDVK